MKRRDYGLELDRERERLVAHTPNCPALRAKAAAGEPVMTVYGCQGALPADTARHSCLESVRPAS